MKQRGFTLIEVLLVLTLFSVGMVSVYGALRSGLLVYERDETDFNFDQELRFFFLQIERDLRNALPYERVPFQSGPSEMSFMTWGTEWSEKGGQRNLYRVTYRFKGNAIWRLRKKLSVKERESRKKEDEVILLTRVRRWNLSFPYVVQKGRRIVWQPTWGFGQKNLPRGVLVRLQVGASGPKGQREVLNLERKILIPQGIIQPA